MAHFEKALKIDPGYVLAHNNLGLALAGRGRIDEAMAQYGKALAIKPDYAEAHVNLGLALTARRIDEAIEHYRKALEIKPDYAEAHANLAIALTATDGSTKRSSITKRPWQSSPTTPRPTSISAPLWRTGDGSTRRWPISKRPWQSSPTMPRPTSTSAPLLANRGRMDEAIGPFPKGPGNQARLCRGPYQPGHCFGGVRPDGRGDGPFPKGPGNPARLRRGPYGLGNVLAEGSRIDEAIDHYQQALVLARQQNKAALVNELQARLRTYEAGSPRRQPQHPANGR